MRICVWDMLVEATGGTDGSRSLQVLRHDRNAKGTESSWAGEDEPWCGSDHCGGKTGGELQGLRGGVVSSGDETALQRRKSKAYHCAHQRTLTSVERDHNWRPFCDNPPTRKHMHACRTTVRDFEIEETPLRMQQDLAASHEPH